MRTRRTLWAHEQFVAFRDILLDTIVPETQP